MHREHHRWFSPALHRDMELLIFGHHGARVLVFPTSQGRFYEWEDRGMMHALREHLERGWLQMYCVDSVDAESWYATWKHPADKALCHNQYDGYLMNEVLPLSVQKNQNPFLITTGASFGGYHALNFGLKHPDKVDRIISMSGMTDVRRFTGGYGGDEVYFNNPVQFIENEYDGGRLAQLRHLDVILAVGRDDGLRSSNEHMSTLLWRKGIGNALRIWDGWSHDWPHWMKMMNTYVGGHD